MGEHGRRRVPHHRTGREIEEPARLRRPHGQHFDELQVDSLDKINLTFAVEEMFAIAIPDDSLNSLKTVGDVVRGVERLRAAPPEPVS